MPCNAMHCNPNAIPMPSDAMRCDAMRCPRSVYAYCTGGIRCEKAAALLLGPRVGARRVLQLRGGIHRYLEVS